MSDAYDPIVEDIQALVDGELSEEDAARVRSVLNSSKRARDELEGCLHLTALAHALREEMRATAFSGSSSERPPGIRPGPRPWYFRPVVVAALPLSLTGMAAAASFMVLGRGDRGGGDPGAAFANALAPRRAIEARLSWPEADRHRPYDTARAGAGERSAEVLSFELLGRIEKLRDPRAMTAAQLLLGHAAQARVLAAPGRSADLDSDRAAIALVEGKPDDALLAAAAALEADPDHVQATWNRALALERLGMPLTAGQTFASVASRGEIGWRDEASQRSAALRGQFERRQSAWKSASAAAKKLPSGGLVDDRTVTDFPGLIRHYLYDAIRAAPSAERLKELRPLARALDDRFGGGYLTAHVDRVARADFRHRAPLAVRYAALAAGQLADRRKVKVLLEDLRAARQDDILLGALAHAGEAPGRPDEADLDEYAALARATGDPWLVLQADDHRGWMALTRRDVAVAQTVLDSAAARCETSPFDYLCLDVFRLVAKTHLILNRPDLARRALDRALLLARATGTVSRETELLEYASRIPGLRDDTFASGNALSFAYLDEWSRQSEDCADESAAREHRATYLINDNRLADAAREMAGDTRPCDKPFTARRAFVLAHLLRASGDGPAVAALRRDIAALRAAQDTGPGMRAFLDHAEGRLLIDRAPAEGRALLRQAIRSGAGALSDDAAAQRARSYSYGVLVDEAAARGASGEALDLLAEERGLPPPARCALGASFEASARFLATVFVARGADGTAMGGSFALAAGEPIGARLVPAALLAALADCESVDVFARQPYYGRPELLPADMAWQFRTGALASEPPPRPGRQVVVANIDTPPGLDLAPLRRFMATPDVTLIEGPAATPARVMAAASDAASLEIHAHGLLGGGESDTSFLVLAPDAAGRYALGGAEIRRARLRGAPVVMLAACHASAIGRAAHSTWGLADAFAQAGARTVIASPDPIPDAAAPAVFGALRARIAAGQSPAAALRDERVTGAEPANREWVDRLVVFR